MGNYSKELKDLILLIDEHKTTIGHAAFDLPHDTLGYDILRQFFNRAHIIRNEALTQLKTNFYDDLLWQDDLSKIAISFSCYMWSLVYARRDDLKKEEDLGEQGFALYHELLRQFMAELDIFVSSNNGKVKREVLKEAYGSVEAVLSMYVRHEQELKLLERGE